MITDYSNELPVLHCLFSYDNKLGGAVHAALNVCKQLAKSGQAVEVIASYDRSDSVEYLARDYPELACHRVARDFPSRYFNSTGLVKWLEANIHRFGLVELHGIFVMTTFRAAAVCRRHGKPYFIRTHGALDPFDLKRHALLKKFVGPLFIRRLLQNSAGIMCTTELEAERLVVYGASTQRIVIPLPVPKQAPLDEHAGFEFRHRHNIPKDALVVLFMSRIDEKKGLQFLIPALGKLKSILPRLWFVLAGSGAPASEQSVRKLVEKHGISQWITMTGFISGETKYQALAAANIFALPSLNENFGIVLVEAMRAGLPLLVSDQVYIHEQIRRVTAGIICQPSINSIAEALEKMTANKSILVRMGRNSRLLARDEFAPEHSTRLLLETYRDTLKQSLS